MFALGCCLVKVVTSLSSIIIIMTSILGVLTFGVKEKLICESFIQDILSVSEMSLAMNDDGVHQNDAAPASRTNNNILLIIIMVEGLSPEPWSTP